MKQNMQKYPYRRLKLDDFLPSQQNVTDHHEKDLIDFCCYIDFPVPH